MRLFLGRYKAEINNIGMLLLFIVPHAVFVLKYGVAVWELVWLAGSAWVMAVVACGAAAGIIRWMWPTHSLLLILVSLTEGAIAFTSSFILLQRLAVSRGLFAGLLMVTVLGVDWIVGSVLDRVSLKNKITQ